MLSAHLAQYGFDDSYLDRYSGHCRVTVVQDRFGALEAALEPFEKKLRRRHRHIGISEFLRPGDMLFLPNELKFEIEPPVTVLSCLRQFRQEPLAAIRNAAFAFTTGVSVSVAHVIGITKRNYWADLQGMSFIEREIKSQPENSPFSIFPFDQWLRVGAIATTWLELIAPDGERWTLGIVVLTIPTRIYFRRD